MPHNRNHLCTNFLVQLPCLALRQGKQHLRSIGIRVGIVPVVLVIKYQLATPSQMVNMVNGITFCSNLQVSRISHCTNIGHFSLIEGEHLPMIRRRSVVGQLVIHHCTTNGHAHIVGHIVEVAVCSGDVHFFLFALSGCHLRWLFASVD